MENIILQDVKRVTARLIQMSEGENVNHANIHSGLEQLENMTHRMIGTMLCTVNKHLLTTVLTLHLNAHKKGVLAHDSWAYLQSLKRIATKQAATANSHTGTPDEVLKGIFDHYITGACQTVKPSQYRTDLTKVVTAVLSAITPHDHALTRTFLISSARDLDIVTKGRSVLKAHILRIRNPDRKACKTPMQKLKN